MTCKNCGGPMKPLLTGMYCVNECDIEDLGDWKEVTKPLYPRGKCNIVLDDGWLTLDDDLAFLDDEDTIP